MVVADLRIKRDFRLWRSGIYGGKISDLADQKGDHVIVYSLLTYYKT